VAPGLRKIAFCICDQAFSDSNEVVNSRQFYVRKYDENSQIHGSGKNLISYFYDLVAVYLKYAFEKSLTQKGVTLPDVTPYLGEWLALNGHGIPIANAVSPEQIMSSSMSDALIRRSSMFPNTDPNSVSSYVEFAGNILTFRYTGWERDDFVFGLGNEAQRGFIIAMMGKSLASVRSCLN